MTIDRNRERRSLGPEAEDPAVTVAEWVHGEYVVRTSRDRVALDVVHRFLISSCWAEGVGYDTVRRSVAHSLPFGVYHAGVMVGFARVITEAAGRPSRFAPS